MIKANFYTVIEVQNDGTPGIIPLVYDDIAQAYHKYYTVLADASVSQIAYHSCHIIRDDGLMIEGKVFDRRVVPTPVELPTEEE